MEQLTHAQHKAAEELYKTAGAGGAQGAQGAPGATGATGTPGGGDVIDAEVVDDK
jgi:hypothetical protein